MGISVKTDVNNEVKYKARLVARGFSQKEGFDYAETFSPTAKIVSIRMLLQLTVNNNFTVHQMDVKSAYLNANLEEELYLDVCGDSQRLYIFTHHLFIY